MLPLNTFPSSTSQHIWTLLKALAGAFSLSEVIFLKSVPSHLLKLPMDLGSGFRQKMLRGSRNPVMRHYRPPHPELRCHSPLIICSLLMERTGSQTWKRRSSMLLLLLVWWILLQRSPKLAHQKITISETVDGLVISSNLAKFFFFHMQDAVLIFHLYVSHNYVLSYDKRGWLLLS